MKLPNLDKAIIEREKIMDYLLNPVHPDNGGKSEFFRSLGLQGSYPRQSRHRDGVTLRLSRRRRIRSG
jgi:hypothetical protein